MGFRGVKLLHREKEYRNIFFSVSVSDGSDGSPVNKGTGNVKGKSETAESPSHILFRAG